MVDLSHLVENEPKITRAAKNQKYLAAFWAPCYSRPEILMRYTEMMASQHDGAVAIFRTGLREPRALSCFLPF
jgi:hypothetical protein